MTPLEQSIQPVYNLVYLVIALGVANLIGFAIYRRNVKRYGQREAYGTGWVGLAMCRRGE